MAELLNLVPNGVGAYTNIGYCYPDAGEAHWQDVDDPVATPDDAATYVFSLNAVQEKDAYALTDSGISEGTINSVTVHFRCRRSDYGATAQPFLRLGTDETAGTEILLRLAYTSYSEVLAKPGGGNWSWANIDALQVCIGLKIVLGTTYCTQIYIAVNYKPVVTTSGLVRKRDKKALPRYAANLSLQEF